ncbi:putative Cell cycle checkpoint protein RAD1 like [Trypanosoma vivax]|uniref:Cell cycle checkpoint protein n=1 Tax=Trypanosoma vivax (strain Y486) TaxID=1055687 RepID=G0TR25_TRYVY|nr:hypothetical protein TRVL_03251 [Trypanosoma vivax]KAH8611944.1 putative Cell cycle checkpoint protein RAD1 like [Trypanosoma vivax]CCC46389.1 conserved hypothetical protein [Trypanosoma vivax Y486]
MSVCCRVAHPHLLLKALAVLTITKNAWVTMEFTETNVSLHVEGVDQSATAAAVIHKVLFSEYVASPVRFTVHLGMLRNALLMGGQNLSTSLGYMNTMLVYPKSDAKLLVELEDGNVAFRSMLATRPVRESPLDLRFTHARVINQMTMRGDVTRDAIEDLITAQCTRAVVILDPEDGVTLRGEDSPFGTVTVHIPRDADAILSSRSDNVRAQTRVVQSHLALACGVYPGNKLWRSTPSSSTGADSLLSMGNGIGGGIPQPGVGGFEHLIFQINERRQLSVLHLPRDPSVTVAVTMVVSPLCDVFDEWESAVDSGGNV